MNKPTIDVQIGEVGHLMAMFNNLSGIAETPEFKQAMLDAALVIESEVKTALQEMVYDAPPSPDYDRTGTLRRVTQATGKIDKRKGSISTGVASSVHYAKYVEYGTEDKEGATLMKPRPYMKTGLEKARETAVEILRDAAIGG